MYRCLFSTAWFSPVNLTWAAATLAGLVAVWTIFVFVRSKKRAGLTALAKHPFTKYVVLSVVVHIAIAIWVYWSHLHRPPSAGASPKVVVHLSSDFESPAEQQSVDSPKPWDSPDVEAVDAPVPELLQPAADLPRIERPEVPPDNELKETSEPDLSSITAAELPDPTPWENQHPWEDEQPWEDEHPWEDQAANEPVEPAVDVVDTSGAVPLQAEPEVAQLPSAPTATTTRVDSGDQASRTEIANDELEPKEQLTPSDDGASHDPMRHAALDETNPIRVDESPERSNLETEQQAAQPVTSRTRDLRNPDTHASSGQPTPPSLQAVSSPAGPAATSIPAIYRDRLTPDRSAVAQARGGGDDTEQAVSAALAWLAKTQSPDGRWDASQYGSGQPNFEGGQDRQGAGRNADAGITGLAVLAFLGSGHTHFEGQYADTVRRGLQFLLDQQQRRSDGSIVGSAGRFARMYCHGIATLALSEAHALTNDPQLEIPVRRAIDFTLSAQHPESGGWRYGPPHQRSDPQFGDTSQFGWQLMALTSAYYSGVPIPQNTWRRADVFLSRVSFGSRGGLAAYRPGYPTSSAMTAEAMLCRLFRSTPTNAPAIAEGAEHLMSHLPGTGRPNYYYWYYGTLALYHLQNEDWVRWNSAVKRELLHRQMRDGSWDPTSVWGASGGRVYSTALATLTLEVYYRYRPLAEPRRAVHTALNRP